MHATGRNRKRFRPVLLCAFVGALAGASPVRSAEIAADFGRLVRETEAARGLDFVRRPAWEIVPDADEAWIAALRAANTPLYAREGLIRLEPVTRAVADPARDRIVATADASELSIRLALANLLDGQHYPELMRVAPRAAGDPGEALRALVAASALATAQGGLGAAPAEPPMDPFTGGRFSVPGPVSPETFLRTPLLAAMGFLRSLADRERAFVSPPLATLVLLRPSLYPGTSPVELVGAAAAGAGCLVERDESLGAFVLARSVVERGASVPAAAIGGWRGDRLVVERCLGDRRVFRYVVLLDGDPAASEFAEAVDGLLPEDLPRPFSIARAGDRVIVAHGRGGPALAWARSLEARPLTGLQELDASAGSRTR